MKTKKYILAFFITIVILYTGISAVNIITDQKLNQLRNIETDIAINILSSETQFALLQEVSCNDISKSILSSELDALASKLSYMEKNVSPDDQEFRRLKKYYSLLEIKDFILLQKIQSKCDADIHYVLYFYSSDAECKRCQEQGFALMRLLKERDNLRVYNFDYNMSLSALDTLKKLYSVTPDLPALVIDGELYGFTQYEELANIIPKPDKENINDKEEK